MCIWGRWRAAACASALVGLGGCSSFSGSDAPPGDAGATADANATDAGTADALLTDDFEGANSGGCVGWMGKQATATIVSGTTQVHAGKSACRVCPSVAAPAYSGIQRQVPKAAAGERYYMEAWVRDESTTKTAVAVAFDLNGMFQTGAPASSTTWQLVSDTLDIPDGGVVTAVISSQAAQGECFLVDDVVVRKL